MVSAAAVPQHADCARGEASAWPAAGAQQADSGGASADAPNIGMLPSVCNDSQAMPAGSVIQYLSERA